MQTTPSGTDLNTLLQEGIDRNIFLSLIVNNAGNYTAMVTRKIASKVTEERCYKTFGNVEICKPVEKYDIQYVEYYFLDIIKEKEDDVFPDIAERLVSIAENKKKPKESTFNRNFRGEDWDCDNCLPFETYTYPKETFQQSITKIDSMEEVVFDEEVIEDIIYKILSCDITMTHDIMPLDTVINKCNRVYDKTFTDKSDFNYFVENFIDALLTIYTPKAILNKVSDKFIDSYNLDEESLLATKLIEKLEELTPNEYIDQFKLKLENYI